MTGNDPLKEPIRFLPHHVSCHRHMEPFRKYWPNGYPVFFTKLWDAILNDPDFREECEDTIESATKLLLTKPMCCRLPADRLLYVYQQVGEAVMANTRQQLWKEQRCVFCKEKRLGTPVAPQKIVDPRSSTVRLKGRYHRHICFQCLCGSKEL